MSAGNRESCIISNECVTAHCALRNHKITGVHGTRQPQKSVCPAGTQGAENHIIQILCQEEKRRETVMDELI
jgi:hypothetical protein